MSNKNSKDLKNLLSL